MSILEKAKEYAIEGYEMTAHLYDGKPYVIHLQMGFDTGKQIYLPYTRRA